MIFSLFYAEKHISRERRSDVRGKSEVYKALPEIGVI